MVIRIKQKTKFNLQPLQQRVPVTFNYNVHFTRGLFELDNPLLAQAIAQSARYAQSPCSTNANAADGEISPKQVIAVVDAGLLQHHEQLLEKVPAYVEHYKDVLTLSFEPVIVPRGEAAKKDLRLIEQIHQIIDAVGLCRHSYVLAIGGGVVLDMVGYAAATVHRGVRLIRVPTTVLSQNDSGVEVKNGINAFGKKNFIGTFMPPVAVLNDINFLTTLDDRDWRSGIAEAVKLALIKDADFFEFIHNTPKQWCVETWTPCNA